MPPGRRAESGARIHYRLIPAALRQVNALLAVPVGQLPQG